MKLLITLHSIRYLAIHIRNSLYLLLNQKPRNSPDKLHTALSQIRHLAILLRNSLHLPTQSDTSQFSWQTPQGSLRNSLQSILNQIPRNSPKKLLTALCSIRYQAISLRNSLQHSTQSDTSQFSWKTPYSSQLNQIPRNSLKKLLTALC